MDQAFGLQFSIRESVQHSGKAHPSARQKSGQMNSRQFMPASFFFTQYALRITFPP